MYLSIASRTTQAIDTFLPAAIFCSTLYGSFGMLTDTRVEVRIRGVARRFAMKMHHSTPDRCTPVRQCVGAIVFVFNLLRQQSSRQILFASRS
jgi:hypothetical protein